MFCNKCKSYVGKNHICKEFVFEVEDYGEMRAYGVDAEDALLNIAKDYNDEGDLIGTEKVAVCDGVEYVMSAQLDVHYSVKKRETL